MKFVIDWRGFATTKHWVEWRSVSLRLVGGALGDLKYLLYEIGNGLDGRP